MNSSVNETDASNSSLPWTSIFLGVILYTVVLITILGNGMVLLAIKREKRLQTVFNYYIVNLAVTDIAVAITAMSFYTLNTILGYWPFGAFMCGVWIFFDYGMTFASVFTLIVISVDRFWSVTWTLHYRSHHSKRKAIKLIIALWLTMLMLWLPPCILDRIRNTASDRTCIWDPALNKEYVYVIASIGHHIPFIILLFCYVKVLIVVRRRQRRVVALQPSTNQTHNDENEAVNDQSAPVSITCDPRTTVPCQSQNDGSGLEVPIIKPRTNTDSTEQRRNSQETSNRTANSTKKVDKERKFRTKEGKVFVTLSYIIIGYMFCWVPFHFVFDISAFKPSLVSQEFFMVTFWLTYLNSTINPFLYNFSSPEFREAFKKILRFRG